jgi:hypothetical protein
MGAVGAAVGPVVPHHVDELDASLQPDQTRRVGPVAEGVGGRGAVGLHLEGGRARDAGRRAHHQLRLGGRDQLGALPADEHVGEAVEGATGDADLGGTGIATEGGPDRFEGEGVGGLLAGRERLLLGHIVDVPPGGVVAIDLSAPREREERADEHESTMHHDGSPTRP